MGQPTTAPAKYKFGAFELDRRASELWKRGIRVKLQEQPCRILCLLLDNPGEVVPRESLYKALWPDDTFVEFERSLNAAVAKLRQALGDSAQNPRFVETVARQGYRFIAPVEFQQGSTPPLENPTPVSVAAGSPKSQAHPSGRIHRLLGLAAAMILCSVIAALLISTHHTRAAGYEVMHRITSDSGLTEEPAISRDGTLLAYASDRAGGGHLNIWVQQLNSGSSAIRLTNSETDDHQPSFSPDGSQIVFRSERDGGGVYVIPSLGGAARLVAQEGRDPSFSPDGKWIAYWVGNLTYRSKNVGASYLVSSSGGVPQRLSTHLLTGYPIWSTDGQHLLALAASSIDLGDLDWWVFAREGQSAVSTHAFGILGNQGFPMADADAAPRANEWNGRDLLFSSGFGDAVNTWTIHLAHGSWQAEGPALRLTSGREIEDHPHLLPGGRMVFAGLTLSQNVWSLPVDANEGKYRNNLLQRLTDKASLERYGSISLDGRYLVFTSTRSGIEQVWLKDLSTGQESRLTSSDVDQSHPEISRDGTMIAFSQDPGVLVVRRDEPDAPRSVCKGCGWVWDWSPDHQKFLYNDFQSIWGIGLFDLHTGKSSTALAGKKRVLYQGRFSPDGKWLAFGEEAHYAESRLFITPLHNGVAGDESEWIPIADATGWCDKPRWSPDGGIVYFISRRDGYLCLWAQHVARDSRRPIGNPFCLMHFHSAKLSMTNMGTGSLEIDVARNKVVFNLGELTGNIWLASKK